MCYKCHMQWWHKNPLEASEWFKANFPARDAYIHIYKGGKPSKISDKEMQELEIVLKQKLSDLEREM